MVKLVLTPHSHWRHCIRKSIPSAPRPAKGAASRNPVRLKFHWPRKHSTANRNWPERVNKMEDSRVEAEVRLPTEDVQADLPFYTGRLGMRLDSIFPADDPAVAVLTGHGIRLRIERGAPEPPGTIRVLSEDPDRFDGGNRVLTAPKRCSYRTGSHQSADDHSRDGTRVCRAAAERQGAVDHWPGRHAVP